MPDLIKTPEVPVESNLVKGMIGFVVLMAVGFLIVGTTRETQQEKVQGAFLQTAGLLNNLALSKCSDAVREEVGTHPYTPSESNSDGMTYVTLVWNEVGHVKRAECRYILDQGITLLKFDDRTVIEKTAPQGSAAPAPKSAHH
ncbi:MAG: hypothetical protein EBY15_07290 [Gammaproteobacteria bacterium]|nr:hypothetical protein [Gammaproteobacteria bacterium]